MISRLLGHEVLLFEFNDTSLKFICIIMQSDRLFFFLYYYFSSLLFFCIFGRLFFSTFLSLCTNVFVSVRCLILDSIFVFFSFFYLLLFPRDRMEEEKQKLKNQHETEQVNVQHACVAQPKGKRWKKKLIFCPWFESICHVWRQNSQIPKWKGIKWESLNVISNSFNLHKNVCVSVKMYACICVCIHCSFHISEKVVNLARWHRSCSLFFRIGVLTFFILFLFFFSLRFSSHRFCFYSNQRFFMCSCEQWTIKMKERIRRKGIVIK